MWDDRCIAVAAVGKEDNDSHGSKQATVVSCPGPFQLHPDAFQSLLHGLTRISHPLPIAYGHDKDIDTLFADPIQAKAFPQLPFQTIAPHGIAIAPGNGKPDAGMIKTVPPIDQFKTPHNQTASTAQGGKIFSRTEPIPGWE